MHSCFSLLSFLFFWFPGVYPHFVCVRPLFFSPTNWFCIIEQSFLLPFVSCRSKRCQQDPGYFVGGAGHGSLNILGSLLAIHHFGKELLMAKTNPVSSLRHVDASQCVENNALVCIMELAVRNIAGMLKCLLIR